MSGTTISAAPHASTPINPASRVPIADPLQTGVKISAAASDIASTLSPFVVTLSSHGITSDATNGIDYGATAPSGSTGQEVAINAILAAAAALSPAGVTIIWDVAVALGAPIYLYSNMTIYCPSPIFGAITRTASNCPIFRLKGMDGNISGNTTLNQQTFGQYDPAHSPNTNYRIFSLSYVNAHNVQIIGGTWNQNETAQTRSPSYNATYGYVAAIQIWGCDGFVLRDAKVFLTIFACLDLVNCNRVVVENCDMDTPGPEQTNGAINVSGPGQNMAFRDLVTHAYDDHICFAPDSWSSVSVPGGVLWAASGPINNCVVDGLHIWEGRENATSRGAVRLLSTTSRLDNVVIRRVTGLTSVWAFYIYNEGSNVLIPGPGNYGMIVYEDIQLDLTSASNGPAVWYINGSTVESVQIRGRYRKNAQNCPDIEINGSTVYSFKYDDALYYQPTGATNNEAAVVVTSTSTLPEMLLDVRTIRDGAVSVGAAPILQNAGTIYTADVKMEAARITNAIVNTGSIQTLKLAGVHRDTGGGSPLSNTGTVTNYIYGQGAYPLAYNAGSVAAVTGGGTVTNTNTAVV